MMKRLINQMKQQAALANQSPDVRMGLVSSYDPDNYCCKVKIQPEDEETGWLPIACPWVGNGWGMFIPPCPGDMVDVHFQEGSAETPYVSLRFYNDIDRPVRAESGVMYIIHKSGSALKFNNDGTVDLLSDGQLNITSGAETHLTATKFVVDAPVQVNGTVDTTGKITGGDSIEAAQQVQAGTNVIAGVSITAGGAIADSTGTMAAMRTVYNGHTHTSNGGAPPAAKM